MQKDASGSKQRKLDPFVRHNYRSQTLTDDSDALKSDMEASEDPLESTRRKLSRLYLIFPIGHQKQDI
jgi:hypothetical protein